MNDFLDKSKRVFSASPLNKKILELALPVFFGMISQTLVHVTDALMIGKLGPLAMAATGLGGTAFFTYIILLMNGSVGVQIVTSRRIGEKLDVEVGKLITTSLVFSVLGCIGFTLFSVWFSPFFIDFLSTDPGIRSDSLIYLKYRNYGIPFFFLSFVIRGFLDGLGLTYVGMLSSIVTLLANVFLNWVLIFGNLGFPNMGISGAAIASSLAGGAGMLVLVGYLFHPKVFPYFKIPGVKLEWKILGYVLRIGAPAAIDGLLTHTSFLLFNKLSDQVGPYSLAANNIIFAVMSLSFMPGFAFGIAATTLVGNSLGAKKPKLAEVSTYRSALFSGLLMGFMGFLFILFAREIIESFNSDPLLYKETFAALIVVSLVQVGDAYHMVMSSALRSAGLVFWVMIGYLVISYLIMLPMAYYFGIILGYGTLGLWSSVSIWLVLLCALFVWKFKKGDWKVQKI